MSATTHTRRARTLTSTGLILAGALLLAFALAYYLYGTYSRARLSDLIVPASGGVFSVQELQRGLAVPPETGSPGPLTLDPAEREEALWPLPAPAAAAEAPGMAGSNEEEGAVAAPGGLAAERPGTGFDFRTLRAEATSTGSGSALGAQFQPVDWRTLPATMEALPPATRIEIPAIGLDSRMVELTTKWEGESLVWETAVYTVGHHRGSPNPGEQGNAVFSGHISSPVSREGAVFKRLPEVATLLREGRTVDIVVEAGNTRYLYRVISTDVREPDEVDVFRPARTPSLTLVTCVPNYIYSHRLLVNAVLVGVAPRR